MDKRGQGLSMNVIIIAAISLLVLVVLAIIFTSRIGSFGEGLDQCEKSGGSCEFTDSCRSLEGYAAEDTFGTRGCLKDQGEGSKCCLPEL